MATWESWVSGPRWAGLGTALRKYAMAYDVTPVYIDHEKGWLSETVFFKLEGEAANLTACKDAFHAALLEYNSA